MILSPTRLIRALMVGAVAGVMVAKDVLTPPPPEPEMRYCPLCGEDHEVLRLEGFGLPILLCEGVPEGHPGYVLPHTPN